MKSSEIILIHNDVMKYHVKYADVQNEENFLKSMIYDKDLLMKKYHNNPFAKDMIFAVYKSLIVTWRERYSGNKM